MLFIIHKKLTTEVKQNLFQSCRQNKKACVQFDLEIYGNSDIFSNTVKSQIARILPSCHGCQTPIFPSNPWHISRLRSVLFRTEILLKILSLSVTPLILCIVFQCGTWNAVAGVLTVECEDWHFDLLCLKLFSLLEIILNITVF